MSWDDKHSKQDFDRASDKQVQQRWYLYAQLSKQGRAEFDALEKKFVQDLQHKLHEQELNKEIDIKRERETLIEKAIRDKHYQPNWARGSLIDEDHFQKLAEHNVIVSNQQEIKAIQDHHFQRLEMVLASEGLYMDKGDSLTRFQEHFNERTQLERQSRKRDNVRGR